MKAGENEKENVFSLVKPLNQTNGQAIYFTDNENLSTIANSPGRRASGINITEYGVLKEQKRLPNIEFDKMKIYTLAYVKFILK